MDKPTVFISYSHKDEAWKDLLRPHLRVLEQTDQIKIWDDRKIDAGDEWYQEIKATMERAAVTICLISADYLASDFCQKEEIPFLLNRRKDDGMLLIPLLVRPCLWKAVPWLKQLQMLPRDGKSISKDFKDDADEVFTSVAEATYEFIEQLKPATATREIKSLATLHVSGDRNIIINGNVYHSALVSGDANTLLQAPPQPKWPALPEANIYLERLPVTGKELFGRNDELNLLDECWQSNATNVLSFIAWGGVGKSTLINHWLEQMRANNYRGVQRVYAWSFYSQGTTERATSADLFIASALAWFGDPDPNAGSPWDKGERLAQLIRRERTLLVLDGLEPLQSAYAHERGKLKDPALWRLLEELARDNPGLCLISTRERLTDLDETTFANTFVVPPSGGGSAGADNRLKAELQTRVVQRDLEMLSPASARALLRAGGVRGTDAELEAGAAMFNCHALALNLLVEYLPDIPGHPIAAAAQIPTLDLPPDQQKDEAPRRMIEALANKLDTGPELNVLRMLGLYDHPADDASLKAIRKRPIIPGLNNLVGFAHEANWLRAVQRLRKYKLIAAESHHAPDELDAHPLVRAHFADQLQRAHPIAWKEGNLRLFEHLTRITPTAKEFHDTLEEMQPLFAAISHGCAAGRRQQAYDEVYRRRIRRENQYFNIKKLGAINADLAALSEFFTSPWHTPSFALHETSQAIVLNTAGFDLRALGRLREAVLPLQAALSAKLAKEDWKQSARAACNLSELILMLGDLPEALTGARQSIELADLSDDDIMRSLNRTTLADVLHQTGRLTEAAAEFQIAETLQQANQPQFPLLYSLPGFRYCELMLSQRQFQNVQTRAAQTLEWSKKYLGLLDKAFDQLALGRAHLGLAQQGNGTAQGESALYLVQSAGWLHRAVDGLRQAGHQQYLPLGLLARAAWARMTQDYDRAHRDLAEARSIATRGEMRLHLTDYHLEAARLALAQHDPATAREHWLHAQTLINETGYHRRDGELAELAEQLKTA
jgi:tetratricopeptide (TPR) repeat protein